MPLLEIGIALVVALFLFVVAIEINAAMRRGRENSLDSLMVRYLRPEPEADRDPPLQELDGIGGSR